MPAAQAAKEETPVFLLAASVCPELIENPHRGHRLPTAVLHQGIGPVNSNTASGLRVFLYDSGRRSRSTGKERDTETGLDFFNARYMSSAQGRFASADPFGNYFADPTNPQSWNQYAYVWNSPLVNIDPSGMSCVDSNGNTTPADDPNGIGDNGDGLGCSAAGVAPGNPNDSNTLNPNDYVNETVDAQEGSWFDYLWATTFNGIPMYVPNDVPIEGLQGQGALVLKAAGDRAAHDLGCYGIPAGTGAAGGGAVVSGQPNAGFRSPVTGKPVGGTKPFVTPGASEGSSTLSSALRDALPQRLPVQVPTPVGGPGTGRALSIQGSNRLGAVLGRWAPFLGGAATLYGAYQLNACLSQ